MKLRCGIYYIQNINNNKIYVGSAVDILSRWRLHRHHLNKCTHHNKYLQSAWNKYKEDSFVFGLVEFVIDKNYLLEREQYWINHYNSCNREHGYNLAPTAGSMLGFNHSDETKKKLSLFFKGNVPWNKGKKWSEQYRQNFMKGKESEKYKQTRRKKSDGFRHTEETKKKISEASSKRILSNETKRKIALSHLGKKMPEGHRENCIKAWKIRKLKKTNKMED
jgi:group I intron endonuclease